MAVTDTIKNAVGLGDGAPASREAMSEARLPIPYRDTCAHLLIPLNRCRFEEYYLPWNITDRETQLREMPIRGVQEAGSKDGRTAGGEGWRTEQLRAMSLNMRRYDVHMHSYDRPKRPTLQANFGPRAFRMLPQSGPCSLFILLTLSTMSVPLETSRRRKRLDETKHKFLAAPSVSPPCADLDGHTTPLHHDVLFRKSTTIEKVYEGVRIHALLLA
ncbi:MAG: hypothetical protein M1830_002070 [Pleopsidium flavum]|nr:MAG: hypothetical protein M1830_002070 [Pleopsidium flavum]